MTFKSWTLRLIKPDLTFLILYPVSRESARPNSSDVNLVGGSGPHEGNIFVGEKPVCDDEHNAMVALVVCRFASFEFPFHHLTRFLREPGPFIALPYLRWIHSLSYQICLQLLAVDKVCFALVTLGHTQ